MLGHKGALLAPGAFSTGTGDYAFLINFIQLM